VTSAAGPLRAYRLSRASQVEVLTRMFADLRGAGESRRISNYNGRSYSPSSGIPPEKCCRAPRPPRRTSPYTELPAPPTVRRRPASRRVECSLPSYWIYAAVGKELSRPRVPLMRVTSAGIATSAATSTAIFRGPM